MKRTLSAAFAVALACGPALGQGNPIAGGAVINAISPDELIAIYTGVGLAAKYVKYEGDMHIVEVQTESLYTYAGLRGCAGAVRTSKCALVQPFARFDGMGVTLGQTNQLNVETMNLSTAMLLPTGSTLIGLKVLLEGGVTQVNLKNYLGLFFLDLAAFAESVEPGTAAQVKFENPAPAAGYVAVGDGAVVNAADIRINSDPKDGRALHAAAERLTAPAQ